MKPGEQNGDKYKEKSLPEVNKSYQYNKSYEKCC